MLNDYIDWLDRSISNEDINYYEYSEFKNVQEIVKGSLVTFYRGVYPY